MISNTDEEHDKIPSVEDRSTPGKYIRRVMPGLYPVFKAILGLTHQKKAEFTVALDKDMREMVIYSPFSGHSYVFNNGNFHTDTRHGVQVLPYSYDDDGSDTASDEDGGSDDEDDTANNPDKEAAINGNPGNARSPTKGKKLSTPRTPPSTRPPSPTTTPPASPTRPPTPGKPDPRFPGKGHSLADDNDQPSAAQKPTPGTGNPEKGKSNGPEGKIRSSSHSSAAKEQNKVGNKNDNSQGPSPKKMKLGDIPLLSTLEYDPATAPILDIDDEAKDMTEPDAKASSSSNADNKFKRTHNQLLHYGENMTLAMFNFEKDSFTLFTNKEKDEAIRRKQYDVLKAHQIDNNNRIRSVTQMKKLLAQLGADPRVDFGIVQKCHPRALARLMYENGAHFSLNILNKLAETTDKMFPTKSE